MLQEFISFCEAMELVPEDELETFTQGGPNSFVDRRAKKVGLAFIYIYQVELSAYAKQFYLLCVMI